VFDSHRGYLVVRAIKFDAETSRFEDHQNHISSSLLYTEGSKTKLILYIFTSTLAKVMSLEKGQVVASAFRNLESQKAQRCPLPDAAIEDQTSKIAR